MLMAFLQRVVNGGGRVEREYGLGRGALDLLIAWGSPRGGLLSRRRAAGGLQAAAPRRHHHAVTT